ncbi:MAG: hypothetical protein HQ541_19465 [Mariniphaga sp.]|nr:hypothetical protein [Mariniphaga sp.]
MAQRPVTIEISGFKKRDVISVRYSFSRAVDNDGQPTSKVAIDGIHVKVKALEDGNTEFSEWMCDPFEYKEGKVVFQSTDKFKKMKELEFKRGYLIFYQETYDEGAGVIEEFEISPQEIKVGGASLKVVWGEGIV